MLIEEIEVGSKAVEHLLVALGVADVSHFILTGHFEDLSDIGWLIVPSHLSL